ncbi:TIGR02677 family protein [uncultured Brevibacillus sp.]|uniref:TIGR02677 family protein n=1 Tax=uncultured Brevibacillus sp. TaxID=169970 RepID=UPI002591D4E2|nr:TIGR02677 family protein [uncultured Brevibacillus sp.]
MYDGQNSHPRKAYKQLIEAKYLAVDNTYRYRAILRYFYEQQRRFRHWLRPEEILQAVKERLMPEEAASYTDELLQNDLQQLYEWQNLERKQSGKVAKIEDFKKKRYRYQATPYTIRLERLVDELEALGTSYGGALEAAQFDKLVEVLEPLTRPIRYVLPPRQGERIRYEIEEWQDEKVHQWWTDLYVQFQRVTNNARDYLASLDSVQVEDAMITEQFLVYKDQVTDYLRRFMLGLQRSSFQIEGILSSIDPVLLDSVFGRVADYERTIPRFDQPQQSQAELLRRYNDQWAGVHQWFLGDQAGINSDLEDLQRETNEAIRRITRYAQRMGERHTSMRSRRTDYLYVAKWFASLASKEEADCLSAAIFGLSHMRHLWTESEKNTEDIYAAIWDTKPGELIIKPRIREFRERTRASRIENKQEEKTAMLQKYLIQKQQQKEILDKIFASGRVCIAELPVVEPFVRQTLLGWIGKSMASPTREGKTEDGRRFKVMDLGNNQRIQMQCTDGVLDMPDFVIYFDDQKKGASK